MSYAGFYEQYCAPKYAPIADLLRDNLPIRHGRVLELAAGTGLLTRRLAQMRWDSYIASDISHGMLQFAASQVTRSAATRVQYAQADYGALPFDVATFDLVAANLALAHENQKSVSEIRRVLAPDGWWVASYWGTGSESELISKARDAAGLSPAPSISEEEVRQLALRAGFAHIAIRTVPVEREHTDVAAFVAHRRLFRVDGAYDGQVQIDAYFEFLAQLAFEKAPDGPLVLSWEIHLITAQAAR